MLQPKKTKFRKAHKGRIHGQATSGQNLSYGQFGLKAVEPDRVTARQIEAARRALDERRDRVRGDGSWFTPDRIADIKRDRGLER